MATRELWMPRLPRTVRRRAWTVATATPAKQAPAPGVAKPLGALATLVLCLLATAAEEAAPPLATKNAKLFVAMPVVS